MSEIPVHSRPRRLVDWINPTGARKVHSLIDKVYQRKNLEMAWEMVKANRGSGGVAKAEKAAAPRWFFEQWETLRAITAGRSARSARLLVGSSPSTRRKRSRLPWSWCCLLYTSDAADEEDS